MALIFAESRSQLVSGQTSLHCTAGTVSSHRRPSLVGSLHFEGMGGKPGSGAACWPFGSSVRRWGLFGPDQKAAGVTAAWIHASARRWGETWIPKYQRSLLFARHKGSAKNSWGWEGCTTYAVDPGRSSLGLFSSIFFLHLLNKKKRKVSLTFTKLNEFQGKHTHSPFIFSYTNP